MKRRTLLQYALTTSAVLPLLPYCADIHDAYAKQFDRLDLTANAKKLIDDLSRIILPLPTTKDNSNQSLAQTPEPTWDFILTMVNDCFSPKDLEQYTTGLTAFQKYLNSNFPKAFHALSAKQHTTILAHLEGLKTGESKGKDAQNGEAKTNVAALRYFYQTTKSLTQKHFTSSKHFMTTYLDYEFIPGRYSGCTVV